MILTIEHLDCGYGSKKVVSDFSVTAKTGEVLCILGANGIGKTTLFKTILGHLPRLAGKIRIDKKEIQDLSQKQKAKYISYVPQAHNTPFAFSVLDVVTMGRIAHLNLFSAPKEHDINIARKALERLGIEHLTDRVFTEISGGERQMVLIARALAQESEFLIMDEPTSNLDFGNQVKVLEVVKRLAESGLGIIMTTHYPDHTFLCRSKVVLMMRDQHILVGSAEEIVTQENMVQAYGVPVCIADVDINREKRKFCQPLLAGRQGGND